MTDRKKVQTSTIIIAVLSMVLAGIFGYIGYRYYLFNKAVSDLEDAMEVAEDAARKMIADSANQEVLYLVGFENDLEGDVLITVGPLPYGIEICRVEAEKEQRQWDDAVTSIIAEKGETATPPFNLFYQCVLTTRATRPTVKEPSTRFTTDE